MFSNWIFSVIFRCFLFANFKYTLKLKLAFPAATFYQQSLIINSCFFLLQQICVDNLILDYEILDVLRLIKIKIYHGSQNRSSLYSQVYFFFRSSYTFVVRRDTMYFRIQFISWLCHYRALSDELYAITNYRVFLYRKTCVLYILVVERNNVSLCIFFLISLFFTPIFPYLLPLLCHQFFFLPSSVLRDKFRPCVENEWFDINLKVVTQITTIGWLCTNLPTYLTGNCEIFFLTLEINSIYQKKQKKKGKCPSEYY